MVTKKVLLIVEGEVTEVEFFSRINSLYFGEGVSIEFFPYKTNIYSLFNVIKGYGGCTETVDVLKTLTDDVRKIEMLNQNFSEIYLIFDAEFQDPAFTFDKIKEMIALFDNETELGKLYVNYPMIESYRDHHYYQQTDYNERDIRTNILNSKNYKSLVRTRGFTKKLHKYTTADFDKTCLMNIMKAGFFLRKKKNKITYDEYRNDLTQEKILLWEENLIIKKKKVSILNTCIFFLVDYFGREYYNSL